MSDTLSCRNRVIRSPFMFLELNKLSHKEFAEQFKIFFPILKLILRNIVPVSLSKMYLLLVRRPLQKLLQDYYEQQ